MIMVIPQLICCGITMKTEINRDHAVPWARALRAGPRTARTALTVTTRH
jgi:hypothetical protein